MFYTYILKSLKVNKYYTGHTDNLEKRIFEHNSGKSLYSKRYMPWKYIYVEKYTTQEESINREKYFKTATGRRWLKKNVNK